MLGVAVGVFGLDVLLGGAGAGEDAVDAPVDLAPPPPLVQAVRLFRVLADQQALALAALVHQQVLEGVLAAGDLVEEPCQGDLEGLDVAGLDAPLLGVSLVGAGAVLRDAGEAQGLDAIALLAGGTALVARPRDALALEGSVAGRGGVRVGGARGGGGGIVGLGGCFALRRHRKLLLLEVAAARRAQVCVVSPLAISSPCHGDGRQGEAGWAGIRPQVSSGRGSNG